MIGESGLFDADYYAGQAGVFAGEALDHYVTAGLHGGFNPHPLFATSFYLRQCPDLRFGEEAPLMHYLETGALQGRQPHPLFDPAYYTGQFLHADDIPADPLRHYLGHHGEEPLRDPHPLFDSAFYCGQKPGLRNRGVAPLVDYVVNGGKGRDPNPFFNTGYFLEQIQSAGDFETPLEAYLTLSPLNPRLDPNRLFESAYYLKHNKDARETRRNPLEHYIRWGRSRGRLVSLPLVRMLVKGLGVDRGIAVDSFKPQRVVVFLFKPVPGEERAQMSSALRALLGTKKAEVFLFVSEAASIEQGGDVVETEWPLDEFLGGQPGRAELATLVAALESPHKPVRFYSDVPERIAGCGIGEASSLKELISSAARDSQAELILSGDGERSGHAIEAGKVIIPIIDWKISGVNRWVEDLSVTLKQKGWNVELLVTGDYFFRADYFLDLPRVAMHHLDLSYTRGEYWWSHVRDYLESQAPAVVLTGYDVRLNSVASVIGREVGFIGVMHSDDPQYYEEAARLGSSYDRIVCVSEHIRGTLVERFPVFADKASVIPYGIQSTTRASDAAAPPDSASPIRLIYVGRLVQKQKCVLDLVLVTDALEKAGVTYELCIVGEGKDGDELRRRFAGRTARGLVRFTGRLAKAEIHRELAASHVFVLTSEFEGLPLALLEAMSQGCVPVVSSMGSGIPEAIATGENGFVVTRGDFPGYARVIRRLQEEPGTWEAMSRKTFEVFRQRYTAEAMAGQYEVLIGQLLEKIAQGGLPRQPGTDYSAPEDRHAFGDLLMPGAVAGKLTARAGVGGAK